MGNAINQDATALWLQIRNDGGWWTASMLTHHWRPTFATFEVDDMLAALVKGKFLEMREQRSQDLYCVTSTCLPLPGHSLTKEAAQ